MLRPTELGRLRDAGIAARGPAFGLLSSLAERVGLDSAEAVERNGRSPEFGELWDEMTMVRRSIPGASW